MSETVVGQARSRRARGCVAMQPPARRPRRRWGGEELDVSDDPDGGAVGAVVGDPVAVVEAAVDGDEPALGHAPGRGFAAFPNVDTST